MLSEFVAERAGSNDYRKMLGVPALIHDDFRRLTALMKLYNRDCESEQDKRKKKNFASNEKV